MILIRARNLEGSPRVAHAFFGRTGGVSEGVFASLNCGPGSGDLRAQVMENRARAATRLLPGASLVTLYQVHGAEAVAVTSAWEQGDGPKADAMATATPGIALGILTADCAPVLFADAEAGIVGAAHAGWKGALAGVTDGAIAAMEAMGARRARIAAAIGPCISQANYEVGAELREKFLQSDSGNARHFAASDREEHFRFDLCGYVAERLRAAGISSVEPLARCTYARESEFYSFRRATHRGESDYGRQLSAIVLRS